MTCMQKSGNFLLRIKHFCCSITMVSSSQTLSNSRSRGVLRLALLLLLALTGLPCASAWGFAGPKDSSAHQRDGSRFTREATTTRDSQLILDMVETLLSTVDTRFKKLDVLDATHRALLDRLGRKMDALDQKVGDTGDNVAAMLNAMRALDNKLVTLGGGGKTVTDALASRMLDLHTKVDALSKSVTQLKDEVKPKTKTTSSGKERDPLLMQGSERRHIVSTPPDAGKAQLHGVTPAERIEREINVVKSGLRSIETKLQSQTNKIATSIATLMQSMTDVREALMDTPSDSNQPTASTTKPMTQNQSSANGTITTVIRSVNSSTSTASNTKNSHQSPASKQQPKISTKFERLFRSLTPLIRVVDQMDHVYGAIISTRRSVDDARSKSEQLLTHSYHTTEALNDVKNDLYLQTNKIMDNLGQVEQWLRDQQTGAASNLDPKFLNAELKELLDRADEESSKDRVSQSLPELDDEIDEERGNPRRRPKNEGDYGRVMSDIEIIPGPHVISSLVHNASRGPTSIVNESYANACPFQEHPGINCADLKSRGVTQSGVYYILIKGTTYWFMKVYCEMETAGGGWTVIQRRDEYGEAHESFNRDWNEYKNGFGDLTKEFWLGNENIFMLTNQDEYNLRIDLEDFDGNKRFAEYSKFKLYSEAENYKLEIGGYDGTAGDSLNDPWYGSNLSPFSTYNRDNDRSSLNCASMLRGGWWWRSCGRGLNGLYLTDPNDLAARQGIVWFRWRGWDYTLKKAQMMIRPKEFEPAQLPQQSANNNNDSTTDQQTVVTDQQSNQESLSPNNSRHDDASTNKSN